MDRLAETHQSKPHSQVPSCPLIPTYALPAPIVSTPDSHHITVNFSSTPFSLDPIQPTFDAATPMDGHSMIKRSAFHDLKDRVEKRIRTSRGSPIPDHTTTKTLSLCDRRRTQYQYRASRYRFSTKLSRGFLQTRIYRRCSYRRCSSNPSPSH